jgi:esterase/lipase superfamily enzyme
MSHNCIEIKDTIEVSVMTRRGLLSLALSPVSYEVETIQSRHQATANFLRIAQPRGASRRTVLILPVTAHISGQWGDGFYEALRLNWVKRYKVTLAAPSFSHLPWFADHPTNPKIAQERYLLEDILPRLPGRILLLGFSKSGNGAMTLLLRHPDKFAAAAAWDAPLTLDAPGKYGSGEIYGTPENFAAYHIPTLLERHAGSRSLKIAISGFGSFQSELAAAHEKMDALGIPHHYDNTRQRVHHWNSGWMDPAMATLDRLTR